MESDKQPASFDVDEFSAVKENLENLEPDSEHRRAVQVEMIVHSKQRRLFRRGTLQGWLGESVHPEVEHLEAEPIHPGRNKPFTSHETIKKFYTETTREEPLNGKRHLEIYLASGEDVVGKAGRPKGSTKAARAAADASVERGRGAGPARRGGGALASSSIAGRGTPGGRGHGADGGWGIGGIGGTGGVAGAQGAGTYIAEEAWERGGRPTG